VLIGCEPCHYGGAGRAGIACGEDCQHKVMVGHVMWLLFALPKTPEAKDYLLVVSLGAIP